MQYIKIIISGLLFIAILSLPYGYYQFLRIAVFIAIIYFLLMEYALNNKWLLPIYAAIGILFNPIIPIYLTKGMWIYIDAICGVIIFISFIIRRKRQGCFKQN